MVSLTLLSRAEGEAAAPRPPSVRGWFLDARRCTADLDRLRRERLHAERLDPRCRNCHQPESWHSDLDGACSDDDGPHPEADEPRGLMGGES